MVSFVHYIAPPVTLYNINIGVMFEKQMKKIYLNRIIEAMHTTLTPH